MRFHWTNQRSMPYGSMSIVISIADNAYMPTNEEVIPLAREIFGMPVNIIYEKIIVRLYWHENIRIFEVVSDALMSKKYIRTTYNYQLYNLMDDFKQGAKSNNWVVTTGSNLLSRTYGFTMVKVVE